MPFPGLFLAPKEAFLQASVLKAITKAFKEVHFQEDGEKQHKNLIFPLQSIFGDTGETSLANILQNSPMMIFF